MIHGKPKIPMTPVERGLIYAPVTPEKSEQRAIEKAFARLFSSDDGQKVLSHLQALTFQRAFGPETGEGQLRYAEGQRALIATILRLIDRGRNGS